MKAVISDFGGVITLPLDEAFAQAHEEIGIPLSALGEAMKLAASRADEPPLFKLERGQITDHEFTAIMAASLSEVTGREVVLDGYGERLMRSLRPNEPLLGYYAQLKAKGVRLAILTNNVREWQPRWMPLLPTGMFELIVDSGFEGVRKPEPKIYEITLSRLGLEAGECAFVDDLEVNVQGANAVGLHGVHFRTTEQTIADLESVLGT
ncbi:HAD family phosphatase [Solirubrobacter sp. CPCC 204708]|uniref:HAD family phosphatase n=1 Tax=Solirubrobacter deserti TaxID=2282478 RepID=A0ABT4RMY0_9ACTN|nr:HAD family phosphatase [Solirubrobacter deserti]MBE2320117.1 HAD family phosphatase [Solirubrobacter deserti]MDA0139835.1 HAD family phosphatase [Solirubrobacter deserti]